MRVHEYLEKLGINPDSEIELGFMVGEVREESAHYKRMVYHSTPIRSIREWNNLDKVNPKERVRFKILDYIVLNTKVHDLNWLSGANWNIAIDNNQMMMLLVISYEEIREYYNHKQATETEKYIDERIMEDIYSGNNPWYYLNR